MKKILYLVAVVILVLSCEKSVNTGIDIDGILNGRDTLNPVGTWNVVRYQGVNEDGSIYDIDEKISEYKKLLRQGGLTEDESFKISYELPRLESAKVFLDYSYELRVDGQGDMIFNNTKGVEKYPLEWNKENEYTFYIKYGYFYYFVNVDNNLCTGYFMTRDCDPEGPNLKIYVKKVK